MRNLTLFLQNLGAKCVSRLSTKGANNKNTCSLCFRQICTEISPFCRKSPWFYDSEIYKRRNEVERFFLRVKRFRKVFTRYDKLDIIYFSVFTLALIFDVLFMRTHSNCSSHLRCLHHLVKTLKRLS